MTLKVDDKGIKRKIRKIAKELGGDILSKQLESLRPEIIKMIIKRTRGRGRGVKDGEEIRLKPLSDSYKKVRKGELAFFKRKSGLLSVFDPRKTRGRKKKIKLHPETTPTKSNLTATGQLLDSIKARKKKFSLIFFIAKRKKKRLVGKASNKVNTQDVAEYVQKDRPFLSLSNKEKKKVSKSIAKIIKKALRKIR